jgi:microcystin-dependent protein
VHDRPDHAEREAGATDGAPANGQPLPISQYQPLFALIGTTYGGNGTSNFERPNLSDLAPNHMTHSICVNGRDVPRQRLNRVATVRSRRS